MTTYRVHFADGDKIDVDAEDPIDARQKANAQRGGIVTKVKVLKGA